MKSKRIISFICIFSLLFSVCGIAASAQAPKGISMHVPTDWEMTVGDSRSVDVTFSPDTASERGLVWSSSDNRIATVDIWGRVTAQAAGSALITAVSKADGSRQSSAVLKVVETATTSAQEDYSVSYNGTAYAEEDVKTLQRIVERYTFAQAKADNEVPDEIKACINDSNSFELCENPQTTVTTPDGAVWTIEDYGIKRYCESEKYERNVTQRFMGKRYLPDNDSTVDAIASDGTTGVWTINKSGVTHIGMEDMTMQDKAIMMSDTTQEYVARRGMVSAANKAGDGSWVASENDNDGLWTSMYGAGEIFRYGTLKEELEKDPNNQELKNQVEDARKVATQSAEAVLLLGNIAARTGTTEAYVRYVQPTTDPIEDAKIHYSKKALLAGNDLSLNIPGSAPSYKTIQLKESFLAPFDLDTAWKDPVEYPEENYAKRTRSLAGFISRTYLLSGLPEANYYGDDGYYFKIDGNEATCKTDKPAINGEYLNGVKVDASGEIPERLMRLISTVENPNTGEMFSKDDIVYKGDTSSDEIVGHLFIYKLAYDILGEDDPELRTIVANTVRNFAQHLVDNGYNLCDATGQPTTWTKYDRAWFYSYQSITDSPLNAVILLDTFKLAAYVTGEKKWEDEYRHLALDDAYKYADLAGEYWDRWNHAVDLMAEQLGIPTFLLGKDTREYLIRNFLNYSNEEMTMLAYYLIFQLEDDEELLGKYRKGIDSWWTSMQYSENPLWYYIYQLAYPNEAKYDAYGNLLVETAAWSLNRHVTDTIRWSSSSPLRDDIGEYDLGKMLGISSRCGLGYDIEKSRVYEGTSGITGAVYMILGITKLEYAVAAPDERAYHKYNGSSYVLSGGNENRMEGSTTYTLPYWMGRYHGMLTKTTQEQEPKEKTCKEKICAWFNELFSKITEAFKPLCEAVDQKIIGKMADVFATIVAKIIALVE